MRALVAARCLALIAGLIAGCVAPAAAAPTLSWDTVTTDTAGALLGPGLEVKTYTVYRCAVNVNPCTRAAGAAVGTVTATAPIVPRQQLDLAGQTFPSVYVVTASNIIAESADSVSIKATPADRPKNLQLTRSERLMLALSGHRGPA